MTEPRVAIGTFRSAQDAQADKAFAGLLVDDTVYPAAQILNGEAGLQHTDPTTLDILDRWDSCWPVLDRAAKTLIAGSNTPGVPLKELTVLAPVRPRQIVCAGANYRKHVIDIMADHAGSSNLDLDAPQRRERATLLMDHRATHGQPFAFLKPVSAILDPFDDLVLPVDAYQTDWELELAAVIGRPAYRIGAGAALDYVAGYTIANDVTARDRIARHDFPSLGLDFVAAKSAPGFLPLGPYIVPASLVDDPQKLTLTLSLNDEKMQHESSADMIFGIARLIEYITSHMRLLPGDIVCTGSPAGNGTHYNRFLRPGDVMEGHIGGLGAQRNRCVAESCSPSSALHRPFAPLPELKQ